MAPEIKTLTAGQTYDGLKADIYSLGITLSLILLGEVPKTSMVNEKSTM